jgi:hypothetical protein
MQSDGTRMFSRISAIPILRSNILAGRVAVEVASFSQRSAAYHVPGIGLELPGIVSLVSLD